MHHNMPYRHFFTPSKNVANTTFSFNAHVCELQKCAQLLQDSNFCCRAQCLSHLLLNGQAGMNPLNDLQVLSEVFYGLRLLWRGEIRAEPCNELRQ